MQDSSNLHKCFAVYPDDQSSSIGLSSEYGPEPTSAGRNFDDDRAAGRAGAGFDQDGQPYVTEKDREDKFREKLRYVATRSAEIDNLCGIGAPQSDDEREIERRAILQRIEEARQTGVEPNFLDTGEPVSKCLLCQIWVSAKEGEKAHPLSDAYLQCKLFDLDMCTRRAEPAMFQGVANLFNTLSAKYAIEAGIDTPQVVTADEVRIHLTMHDKSNPKRPILHLLLKAEHLANEAYGACVGVTADNDVILRPVMMDAAQKQGRCVMELSERLRSVTEMVSQQLEQGPKRRKTGETNAFRIRGGGVGKTKTSSLN